jgi:hypothetical protein
VTAYSRDTAVLAPHGFDPPALIAKHGRRFGDVFVFIVPLLLSIEFAAGGRLFLSEVVLLLALPFLLHDARRRGVSRVSQVVVALGLVWLFGLLFTDIYRETPFHDYSRGWSKVAFLLLNFAALSLLIDGRWRRVTLFAAGLAVGWALQFFVNPDGYAAADPWKFGYGGAVTLAGVVLASRPAVYRRPVAASGILLALGVINLKMDFRSEAGVCLLTALIVVLAARSGRLVRLDRRAIKSFTVLAASVLAGFVIVDGYEYAAGHGSLGAEAQQKYEAQQSSFGILLSGRPQVIVAIRAIRDSPIIGHGSWAKDPTYAAALQAELRKAGYRGRTLPHSPDIIPTHSHVLGAWVEAGILGPLLWLWALLLALSVLPRVHHLADGRVVLVAFLGTSFLWDVLFSPFGAQQRLIMPFYLVVLLLARQELSPSTAGRDGP